MGIEVDSLESVKTYRVLVGDLLDKASQVRQDGEIEPPLTAVDLGETLLAAQKLTQENITSGEQSQQIQYAAIETAFREKFYDLLATTSIDDPDFIQVWNLLDIISIFSDNEQCEPGLIFWLIEELLDSQTIDGCRMVFDYLESRRERNTAKHFKQKSLIILRSCNELLRRLSRAEDTVFCGRVFIFLFQSFPLGDKSSVNLRGEYHTENVTTYDEVAKGSDDANAIEQTQRPAQEDDKETKVTDGGSAEASQYDETPKPPTLITPEDEKKRVDSKDASQNVDLLYPMFWGLQNDFSAPTRLFNTSHLESFKTGLEATLATFKNVNTDLDTRQSAKTSAEERRGLKRKRTGEGEMASSFNPKYLTSRDLFELEINDVAFRRHILVQSLIILDFMLSLTPKAKSKVADLTNKSVLYGYVLNDDDARWATQMKSSIVSYLQQGIEGKFYYRMIDNVLSRDKNWVRWKAEGCPPIEKAAISIENYLRARDDIQKVCANKRLRSAPLGSLDLRFLTEEDSAASAGRLKDSDRFNIPAPDSFLRGIADDEFNMDMSQSNEEREDYARAKTSKTWRMLRLASRNRLNRFDKIDDGKNIKALFETTTDSKETGKDQSPAENGAIDKPEQEAIDGENKTAEGTTTEATLDQPTSQTAEKTDGSRENGASG